MKLTTYARFIGVCFVQYVASHPALDQSFVGGNDESSLHLKKDGQRTNTFSTGVDNSQSLSFLKNTTRNGSKIYHENGVVSLDGQPNEGRKTSSLGDDSAVQNPQDFHNLSVFEYIEKFNATEAQDRNEIDHFLANQRPVEDQDGSEGQNVVAGEDLTAIAGKTKHISPEARKCLEEEFFEHYQRSGGRWHALTDCTTDQRIELCKEAYRRVRNYPNQVFHAEQMLQPMKVFLAGREPLTTELLKCSIASTVWKWNGLARSETRVFLLGEGNSPTEVYKLSASNVDSGQIEGKIVGIKLGCS